MGGQTAVINIMSPYRMFVITLLITNISSLDWRFVFCCCQLRDSAINIAESSNYQDSNPFIRFVSTSLLRCIWLNKLSNWQQRSRSRSWFRFCLQQFRGQRCNSATLSWRTRSVHRDRGRNWWRQRNFPWQHHFGCLWRTQEVRISLWPFLIFRQRTRVDWSSPYTKETANPTQSIQWNLKVGRSLHQLWLFLPRRTADITKVHFKQNAITYVPGQIHSTRARTLSSLFSSPCKCCVLWCKRSPAFTSNLSNA